MVDATFNSGKNYIEILQTLIEYNYQGKIALQCRPEMITTKFLDIIEKLNLTATVVLELGLQSIHKSEQTLIGRPSNMKSIKRVLNELTERNIEIEISLICGLPNQTIASFLAPIGFCHQNKVPVIHAFPLMLLRGTVLYDKKQELKLTTTNDLVNYNIGRI